MKAKQEMKADAKYILAAVRGFFAGRRHVYADPSSENFSANFYGMEPICKLTQGEVCSCIEMAANSWNLCDEDGEPLTDNELLDAAIEAVTDDLQYDRPRQ